MYRELLAAPQPRQVAAALDGLDELGDGSLPTAAVPFLAHPSPRVRHAAVHAVDRRPDPELARTGRADLLTWLQRDAATAYGRPSAEQAAQIAARLATSPLTSEQRRKVAFVTGIRPEPAV